MTKEFAFQQWFCNSAAVNRTKNMVFPFAWIMNYPGNILFPGSTFSGNKHVGLRIFRGGYSLFEYFKNLRADPDKLPVYFFFKVFWDEWIPFFHLLQPSLQLDVFLGTFNGYLNINIPEWFTQIIECPEPHGFDHRIHIAMSRNYDDLHIRVLNFHLFQYIEPIHTGQSYIKDQEINSSIF